MGRVSLVASKLFYKMALRRKMSKIRQNSGKISQNAILISFHFKLVCRVVYMESINYTNLIEISSVVIEIWGIENGDLAVLVNNTLMYQLAADTHLCILICLATSFPYMLALSIGWQCICTCMRVGCLNSS